MDVSIIMINYCTYELTVNAINSIFEYTKDISYELILVDNASPDNSGQMLKEKFQDSIKYIQSPDNSGTSRGFNMGYNASTGKYILWLNTDILIKDNFIKKLYDYMEKDNTCGIVGGNILDFNGNPAHSFRKELTSIASLKRDYSLILEVFRKVFKKSFMNEYNYKNKPLEVGYITGADLMVRKSIIDEIGPFCEDIFMYAEETEFTFRMKKNTNYKAICLPDAHMYHLEGASFNADKGFSESRFIRSANGVKTYFKKSYGEKYGLKYLKLCKKNYKKLMLLARVTFNKEMHKLYNTKNELITKLIEEESK